MSIEQLKRRYASSADECFASVKRPLERVKSTSQLDRHALEMIINQMNQAVKDLSKLQVLMEAAE